MINLSRFSKISFHDLQMLPNYYIHEIYKQFVNDSVQRAKDKEREELEKQQQARAEQRSMGGRRDSQDVQHLRNVLSGVSDNDFEELLEELDE